MKKVTRAAIALALMGCTPDPIVPPDAGLDAAAHDATVPCTLELEPEEALPDPARHTPRWAFEPWISKDISDREDTLAFVQGFLDRNIPVGAVVLDSPWDSQYTTFVPNPERYGDFPSLVTALHEDGVRVVLWTTAFVNLTSFDLERGGDVYRGPAPNYREGLACGLFVNDGELYAWWKGRGASVDFFDPRARAWWHAQQDTLLATGIDGWKLDFGDSYLEEDATLSTEIGPVEHQRYSEEYYRDFLAYGVMRRGPEFTTMVRAWDESYDRRGRFHARPEHAPVVWMGDNHRDWSGLIDVLDHTFRSARAGYVVLGSDLGGYLDRDQHELMRNIPFDVEVFQRWTALSAMSPFMQLHGRGNLAPWTVPGTPEEQTETTDIYRWWATLHHAMVPFWYSLAEEAYASDGVIVHPLGDEGAWVGDWRYVVGEAFLVAPIHEPGGVRDVALPDGARWYDFWDPAGDPIAGGTTLSSYDASDRARIPLFVREGAIVPLHVESDVNGLGSEASAGFVTVLAWPGTTAGTFALHEADDGVTTITAVTGRIGFAPARASVIVRARLDATPAGVLADGTALSMVADRAALDGAASGWTYDASERALWVKSTAAVSEITIE